MTILLLMIILAVGVLSTTEQNNETNYMYDDADDYSQYDYDSSGGSTSHMNSSYNLPNISVGTGILPSYYNVEVPAENTFAKESHGAILQNLVMNYSAHNNTTFMTENIMKKEVVLMKRLCGYLINYNRSKCLQLNTSSQPLSNCEYIGVSAIFGIVVCSLSLTILFGNALVIFVIAKTKEMRTKYNFIKASLAVADLLCGLILLGFVIPNMFYVRSSTEEKILDDLVGYNSAQNVFVGAILTLSIQSSLLHLMFLSIDRFRAIKWPLRHMQLKFSTFTMSLASLWVIACLCSFVPVAFEDVFGFTFQPVLFLSSLTFKPAMGRETAYHGLLYQIIVYGVPYLIMVVVSISTGVVIYKKLQLRALRFGQQSSSGHSQGTGRIDPTSAEKATKRIKLKQEISMFITLVVMILTFTITLLPSLVVQLLAFSNAQNCSNYSIPYAITFYIGVANSFANVVIYSIREERFRKAVAEIFNLRRSNRVQNTQTMTRKTDIHPNLQRT